jgi:hypothetical protein
MLTVSQRRQVKRDRKMTKAHYMKFQIEKTKKLVNESQTVDFLNFDIARLLLLIKIIGNVGSPGKLDTSKFANMPVPGALPPPNPPAPTPTPPPSTAARPTSPMQSTLLVTYITNK